LGVLPQGYIYPKEQRPVRDLLRKRSQLVRYRTANLLSIQNLFTRNTGSSMSVNQIKGLQVEEIDGIVTANGQPVGDAQCRRTGRGSRTNRHRAGET
jgi:transposase